MSRTFRVFVSSTFEDLKEERNALQRHVFRRLRELCEEGGTRFQAIDLRWGVSAEAGLDQRTIPICLKEVARCQQVSPRPNFIVLLGDRYGWRPPPAEIPADEFEAIREQVPDTGDRGLLDDWYRRDDNAVPPVYVLQPRRVDVGEESTAEERRSAEEREAETWSKTESRLREILLSAIDRLGPAPEQRMKYESSATEQEIVEGALQAPDAHEHVFAFFRRIDGLPTGDEARSFRDLVNGSPDTHAEEQLDSLKSRLRAHLPGHVFEPYGARWTGKGLTDDHIGALPEDLEECKRLLDDPPEAPSTLCVDVWCSLGSVIRSEIAALKAKDSVEQESDAQLAFGNDRARHFTGREEPLRRIRGYIEGGDNHPLAVVGASGSGKSALMARAAGEARKRAGAVVVNRFIGATPESTDGRSLLETLCRQVSRAYGADETDIPTDYRELVKELPERLRLAEGSGKPLIVFLDALDQLAASEGARSLAWLPAELPGNVRVIVSTMAGAGEAGEEGPATPSGEDCLRALEAKLPRANLVELAPMSTAEGEDLLGKWLEEGGRTLQHHQRDEVLGKFGIEGLPLYLKLGFEEARNWRSYADPGATTLAPGIPGIIREDLFARLSSEDNHGAILVAGSLGYLAAAKNGLSEDEVLDVLSRDQDVLADFARRSPRSPEVDRLPVVVWSRLYLDLEPYLTERSADGASLLTFYHRQLREVVEADYLAGETGTSRHRALAGYFSYERPEGEETSESPLTLRKMSELPYQQTMGEQWDALEKTLTDFHFLERKAVEAGVVETRDAQGRPTKSHTGIFLIRDDFALALERMPGEGGGPTAAGRRPLILTAVDGGEGPAVTCPVCHTEMRLTQDDLGGEMTCRNQSCRRSLKINPFVVERERR